MKDKILSFRINNRSIKDMFRHVEVEEKDNKVYITLKYDDKSLVLDMIKKELMRYIKIDLKYPGAKIEFVDYAMEQLEQKSILNRQDVLYLIVSSGKGGVGKSNVSANLANAFSHLDYNVALVDCDIYGSSIPNIFNIEHYPPLIDEVLQPVKIDNIEVVSIDFITRSKAPIMWRGPMLGKALNHFFYFTNYSDDIDVVIFDMPPGTGDMALDMQRFIPHANQIVVTTPHPDASAIAIKAGEMAQHLKHNVIGVVENMSYYQHNDEQIAIFGVGGGDIVANKLNVPLLDKLAIAQPKHGSLYQEGEANFAKYLNIINKIMKYHK